MKRTGVIERTIVGFAKALARAVVSEDASRQSGLLQSLDPRVRVVGIFALVVAVILSHKLAVMVGLFVLAVALGLSSRVSIANLAKRVWAIVLGFTGIIALPAIFLTPGDAITTFANGSIKITAQGLTTAALLIGRVETAVTLTTVLVLCTPWALVLKSLRWFRLPQEVIAMLAMTCRYIFLLAETAGQMYESRQSRTVGILDGATQRLVTARTAGVLLNKSIELSNGVYLAMQSRGFTGDIQVLSDFRMHPADYAGLLAFLVAGGIAVWLGR